MKNKFEVGNMVTARVRPFIKMVIIAKKENEEKEMVYACRWFNELKQEFIANFFSSYELEGVDNE